MRPAPFLWFLLFAPALAPAQIVETIIVDQFGYRPKDAKIVVFAAPQEGQNAIPVLKKFNPGDRFEVRAEPGNAVVFEGPVRPWKGGAVDRISGDRTWHGDFSEVKKPGTYHVAVPGGSHPGARSYSFRIRRTVYAPALLHSVRSFYYQRCGTAIPREYGGKWTHGACHLYPGQDGDARPWPETTAGRPRDVHGGWHDAGDYRKYVPWTYHVIWSLLHAWEWYPEAFSDGTKIPESGNGVPDILDEVKYELDWLLRMQGPDGGASAVVGVTGKDGGSPPDEDRGARRYAEASTVATASVCASFAHGARVFRRFGKQYPGYAAKLERAAVRAWKFLEAHPANVKYTHKGFKQANANVDEAGDRDRRICAAAEMFRLTRDKRYRTYFDMYYDNHDPRPEKEHHPITSNYFENGKSHDLQRGFVSYAQARGASPGVVRRIKESLSRGVEVIMNQASADPYLAHIWEGHYCWGSNAIKCYWGNILMWGRRLKVKPWNRAELEGRAEEYLHYIHGRNPLNLVYLTNMGTRGADAGADKSVMELYHGWFHDGTEKYDGADSEFGPAPGFMPGGPNRVYNVKSPPKGEPPMKAYLDWNTSWPENSWEVTENAIGYQSEYTLLVAAFAR